MKNKIVAVFFALLLTGCVGKDSLKDTLKKNPDILKEAIEANPVEFITALQNAALKARPLMAEQKKKEEEKKFEENFDKPLSPEIRSDELIRGTKGASIVLVEYSDFECPYCRKGFENVRKLLSKYKGKIQFIYKHLPLSFHKNAMIASQYYEAIRLQSEKKAVKFHDMLFDKQRQISKGEPFLKSIAKKVGADMKKLAKDINSKVVIDRIKADQKEAQKFGIQGTPGFILNGVAIRGAYPVEYFDMIINKLKEKKKISI